MRGGRKIPCGRLTIIGNTDIYARVMGVSTKENVVARVLAKGFGTQRRLADAADRAQSTVAGWKRDNLIPSDVIQRLLDTKGSHKVPLEPADFFLDHATDHLPKPPAADPCPDEPPVMSERSDDQSSAL